MNEIKHWFVNYNKSLCGAKADMHFDGAFKVFDVSCKNCIRILTARFNKNIRERTKKAEVR